jgi:redox-sensitive bicupin YhaK (pirin superfamily)
MIYLRQAEQRGHANHGWLDSWHSFSFADYYDADFMGFSALRVINEDIIAPGKGFGRHPHNNMEILTYVLEGTVEHQDSMGNKTQIPAGEFQIMSAGSGITHSEYNPHDDIPLHLYQIWILPNQRDLKPRYEQRRFPLEQGQQWILSPDGRHGSLKVFQEMNLLRWRLSAAGTAHYPLGDKRCVWLQVVKGSVTVNGQPAQQSDGVALWQENQVDIVASEDAEVLLFDLPVV